MENDRVGLSFPKYISMWGLPRNKKEKNVNVIKYLKEMWPTVFFSCIPDNYTLRKLKLNLKIYVTSMWTWRGNRKWKGCEWLYLRTEVIYYSFNSCMKIWMPFFLSGNLNLPVILDVGNEMNLFLIDLKNLTKSS